MNLVNQMTIGLMPLVPKFIVGQVASRYIAGETVANAFATIKTLQGEGAMATVDVLGEHSESKEQAAEALKLTAADLLEQGIIDRIVPEPGGGAHRNHEMSASTLKKILVEELKALAKMKPDKLVEKRVEKFSKMGAWKE